MDRRRDPANPNPAGPPREREPLSQREREQQLLRELVEFETAGEGTAGEGLEESGTLPGSVGGTTGESDRAAGTQSPGASLPPVPGIDPAEARRLVGRFRRSQAELETEEEETTSSDEVSHPGAELAEEVDTEDL